MARHYNSSCYLYILLYIPVVLYCWYPWWHYYYTPLNVGTQVICILRHNTIHSLQLHMVLWTSLCNNKDNPVKIHLKIKSCKISFTKYPLGLTNSSGIFSQWWQIQNLRRIIENEAVKKQNFVRFQLMTAFGHLTQWMSHYMVMIAYPCPNPS